MNRASDAEKVKQENKTQPQQTAKVVPVRQPYRINLEQALQLALINSREFQTQRETLYLAALPVTTEQFNFLPQFMATQEAIRQWSGEGSIRGPSNQWELNSGVGVTQNFITGASLLLKLANQTVVDVSSSKGVTVSTPSLVFDISQPLLRGGGMAVALEPLTQSERNLLYEVRSSAVSIRSSLFRSPVVRELARQDWPPRWCKAPFWRHPTQVRFVPPRRWWDICHRTAKVKHRTTLPQRG